MFLSRRLEPFDPARGIHVVQTFNILCPTPAAGYNAVLEWRSIFQSEKTQVEFRYQYHSTGHKSDVMQRRIQHLSDLDID
jgi:hypothetical protein